MSESPVFANFVHLIFAFNLQNINIILCVDSWPDALAVQAHPREVPFALKNYWTIADLIWRGADDQATDLSWYKKRVHVSGIYASSELFLVQDCSPDQMDTWRFLHRRVDELITK